jgi:hypothetical protein
MSSKDEVISAFLDDETFAPQDLTAALSEPDGRTLLIDLISLRGIVQPSDPLPAMKAAASASRIGWRVAAAAAALFVGLTGGYLLGERRSTAAPIEAPPPARVVQAVPLIPVGGGR